MTDLEKVVKGLEACSLSGTKEDCIGYGCPYLIYNDEVSDDCQEQMFDDALALLKTQEPRLMTLEEIQHTDAVWLETHGWVGGDVFETVLRCRSDFEDYVTEFATNDDCDITCVNSKIGIEWRCWTSRPTDEQREATPWE